MALREILAHFGFSFDKAALHEAGAAINAVKHNAHGAGIGLNHLAEGLKGAFAAFIAGEVAHITHEIAEQGAALQDLSQQTGLSTNDLQAWTLEAQLSGASAEDFTMGLRKLSRELATGVDETGQQSKLFKQLHISAKDASGGARDLADVLPEIAEKFKHLTNGAQKSALAQQLFGRAGTRLVPLLSKGAEGIEEMKKQFEELGGGFSPEAIKRSKEYEDSLIKLNFTFFAFKSLLATSVFPILSDVIGSLTHGSVEAGKWLKETTLLGNGVKALAALLTGKLLLALAPFLLPGLKFIAIFLAIDDLLAFLEGKDSIIGSILNSWFGNGTATVVRQWANDAATAIKGTFIGALDLIRIAFSDTDEASTALWAHFEASTRPVEAALDSIADKIKLIFDAFTDWDTLTTGVKDFGDLLSSPFKSDEEKKRQQNIAGFREGSLDENFRPIEQKSVDLKAQVRDLYGAVRGNPAQAGLPEDYFSPDKDRRGQGERAYKPLTTVPTASQSIYNYNIPINVSQEIKGRVDAVEVKRAAEAGVKKGIEDYRAALENLEQRSIR